MSDYKRRRGGRGYHGGRGGKRQTQKNENRKFDESSPVIQAFLGFQSELDKRHDKHERLVKLSRDITIESKRAIFLLQRITGSDEEEAVKILSEAESKFTEVQETKWRDVANELQNEDPYHFIRAYTAGLQEYVEAVSFWYYLKHKSLVSWQQIQKDLIFPEKSPDPQPAEEGVSISTEDPPKEIKTEESPGDSEQPIEMPAKESPTVESEEEVKAEESRGKEEEGGGGENSPPMNITVHVPPTEYMLGIADLTGELMRSAINAIGQGQLEEPHKICTFLRCIYESFMSYGNSSRELNRKLTTLKQSLTKVENACYTLQVRGSEVPKDMLAEVIRDSASSFDTEIDGD